VTIRQSRVPSSWGCMFTVTAACCPGLVVRYRAEMMVSDRWVGAKSAWGAVSTRP